MSPPKSSGFTPPVSAGDAHEGTSVSRAFFRAPAVDFFGSLVPGLVFVLTTLFTVGTSFLAAAIVFVYVMKPHAHVNPEAALRRLQELVSYSNTAFVLLVLMLSYVVGHSFYRQDPKRADRRSFRRLFSSQQPRGVWAKGQDRVLNAVFPRRAAAREKKREKDARELEHWVVKNAQECEFPYPHLREYLTHRKLKHLAQMVSWSEAADAGDRLGRTKNFVNVLKIRLAFHYPDRCGAISRNEAHVRLMSSTWYMSRVLRWPATLALGIALSSAGLAFREGVHRADPAVFSYIVFPVLLATTVLVVSFVTTRSIEKFLHYQRVREVVWVLETAYTAFRGEPTLLQKDVCPHFCGQKVEADKIQKFGRNRRTGERRNKKRPGKDRRAGAEEGAPAIPA